MPISKHYLEKTTVAVAFPDSEHPLLMEWMHERINRLVHDINAYGNTNGVGYTVRYDSLDEGRVFKLEFDTDYLGCTSVFAHVMGKIKYLADKAKQYTDIDIIVPSPKQRSGRFIDTQDFGLMLNPSVPMEIRRIGKAARDYYGKNIQCIYVIGEGNRANEVTSRIRELLFDAKQWKYNWEWVVTNIRNMLCDNTAVYIKTKDEPLGQVIHAPSHNLFKLHDAFIVMWNEYVCNNEVNDVLRSVSAYDNAVDFYAFMEVIHELPPAARINQYQIKEIMEHVGDV